MIAKDRGRGVWLFGFVLAIVMIVAVCPSRAQQNSPSKFKLPPPAPNTKADPQYNVNVKDIDVPGLKPTPTAIPVNPGDPIAIVNGQIISRQQLADECVAKEGKKVLELLIHRTLIDQGLRARKLEVTAAEIDQEIDTVAQRFGINREQWLRTLDKERGISPVQYARDIIYPAPCVAKTELRPSTGHSRRYEECVRGTVWRKTTVPYDPARQTVHRSSRLGATAAKPRGL